MPLFLRYSIILTPKIKREANLAPLSFADQAHFSVPPGILPAA